MNTSVAIAINGQVVSPPPTAGEGHLPHLDGEPDSAYFKLREGCSFYSYDNAQDTQEFIICTPDNRQFKISALAKEILEQFDGDKTLQEVASALERQSIRITAEQLRDFLKKQYGSLGIFENFTLPKSEQSRTQSGNRRIPFFFHWDLIPKRFVGPMATRLRFLYGRTSVIAGLLIVAFAHYAVYIEHPASRLAARPDSLWVLLLCLSSILFHEFGHATAVSKFGGSPGTIGFGLYVLLPSFYADVSEVWRFRRRQRIVVDLGGMYFQELSFALFALLAILTSAPEFFAVCYFIDFMVLLNLNPAFHFDGYWLLVDYLAMPNLHRIALGFIKSKVKRIFGTCSEVDSLPPLRRHQYWMFIVYAFVANAFLLVILWISYRYVGGLFTRIHVVYPGIFRAMVEAARAHDALRVVHLTVTMFFAVAFPATALLGIYRYLNILVGRALAKFRPHKAIQQPQT